MYIGVEMDPIVPQLLVEPSFIEIQPSLIDGLHLDNHTGIISGTPSGSTRSKSVSYAVTVVTPDWANATASFTLLYVEHSEYLDRGVIACILEEEVGFNMIAPELFSLYPFRPICHIQDTLSWSDQYDANSHTHQNSLFPSSAHGFLRFVTHFESDYASPTTFILSSCSRLSIFIDSHTSPFLEEEASAAVKERRGTIFLGRGLHRVVILLSTYSVWEGKVFFSLSFSVHSQGLTPALLTSESLVLPSIPPLSLPSILTTHQHIPHAESLPSLHLAQHATPTTHSPAISLLNPATPRLFSPVPGNTSLHYIASNTGGETPVQVTGHTLPSRHGLLVTVSAVAFSATQHFLHQSRFAAPRRTVQQEVVPTVSAFNASALPHDVAEPLVEFNATLAVHAAGPFQLEASVRQGHGSVA